jgi:hypothetical protein
MSHAARVSTPGPRWQCRSRCSRWPCSSMSSAAAVSSAPTQTTATRRKQRRFGSLMRSPVRIADCRVWNALDGAPHVSARRPDDVVARHRRRRPAPPATTRRDKRSSNLLRRDSSSARCLVSPTQSGVAAEVGVGRSRNAHASRGIEIRRYHAAPPARLVLGMAVAALVLGGTGPAALLLAVARRPTLR